MSKIFNLTPEEKAKRRAKSAQKRLEMLKIEMRKDVARLHAMLRQPKG